MSIGGYIRAARVAHRLSQRELAKRLGVHHAAVWQWEQDQTTPDIAHRIVLSSMLDIRFTDLLPETQAPCALVTEPNLVAIVKLFEPLPVVVRAAWVRLLADALARDLPALAPAEQPARRRKVRAG